MKLCNRAGSVLWLRAASGLAALAAGIALASPALGQDSAAQFAAESPTLLEAARQAREQAGSVLVERCLGTGGEELEPRITACESLIEVSPATQTNPFPHLALAVAHQNNDDWENAAAAMARASQYAPQDGYVLMLATGYRGAAEPAFDMRPGFQQAAILIPNNAFVWHNLGQLSAAAGELSLASEQLTRSIALLPELAENYAIRAQVNLDLGSYAAAIEDAHQALWNGYEGMSPMLLVKSQAYSALGDHARAEQEAQDLVDRDIEYAPGYNILCWSQVLQRKSIDALANCNRALELDPENAAALDSRGMVHLHFGNNAAAQADYEAPLAIAPDFVSALYGRGIARRRLGDDAGGRADQRRALELDTEVRKDYLAMGFAEAE